MQLDEIVAALADMKRQNELDFQEIKRDIRELKTADLETKEMLSVWHTTSTFFKYMRSLATLILAVIGAIAAVTHFGEKP